LPDGAGKPLLPTVRTLIFCTNFPENMLMFLGKEADIFLKTIASV
jgi:hypothetical protein